MSYLLIGILFSKIEIVFAIFFDFIPETTEASFQNVLTYRETIIKYSMTTKSKTY